MPTGWSVGENHDGHPSPYPNPFVGLPVRQVAVELYRNSSSMKCDFG